MYKWQVGLIFNNWDNYIKNFNLSLFCKKITLFFISTNLDLDILIFYKLVPWVIYKDVINLNKTLRIR